MPGTILGAGKTVVSKTGKVCALRAYIPVGKMNNKQTDFSQQAMCRALGIQKRKAVVPGSENLSLLGKMEEKAMDCTVVNCLSRGVGTKVTMKGRE